MTALPLLPTSVIGSYAWPAWFVTAVEAIRRGEYGPADTAETLNDAVDMALRDQEEAGVDIVTDGEMRRLGFFTADFYGRLTGLQALPPERLLVIDEALVDFQSAEPRDAVLRLTDTRPVVCLRSFSKAFGLAGMRVGYAVLPPTYADRASALAPLLGVSVAAVAAARHALARRVLVEAYVEQVRRERERLSAELRRRRFEVAPSETNFLWVAPPDGDGTSFARRLDRLGIRVTPGVALGDGRRVRIAVRDRATSERLLQALDRID